MKLQCIVLLLATQLTWATPLAASDPLRAKKLFIATSNYQSRRIEGWLVHINTDLLTTHKQIGDQAVNLLTLKLHEIRQRVPPKALSELLKVPIWLGVDDYAIPNPTYHPSSEWLRSHGWNPDKAKSVEIGNAAVFVAWSEHQPMMVLHELAHSYHDQVLTYQFPAIISAYQHAVQSGRYQSVKYYDGSRKRAYALTNEQEYFAETSEAYFGVNDFEPFTRSELEKFDPEMFAVLKSVWNR